jgi:hypothetical protein
LELTTLFTITMFDITITTAVIMAWFWRALSDKRIAVVCIAIKFSSKARAVLVRKNGLCGYHTAGECSANRKCRAD